jgi:hypothetical protein
MHLRLDLRDNMASTEDHMPEALLGLAFTLGGANTVIVEEKPADSDGDGLLDPQDYCPLEPAQTPDGCPLIRTIIKRIQPFHHQHCRLGFGMLVDTKKSNYQTVDPIGKPHLLRLRPEIASRIAAKELSTLRIRECNNNIVLTA